jgi:hypothetical protein
MPVFIRRENPPAYTDCRQYKPFLRRDFLGRCVYCERTEAYLGGDEAFEVEHFRPKSRFPELVCSYPNLYYACRRCNGHKSDTWPSDEQMARGLRFADPCEEDLWLHHLREREDGSVEEKTTCGAYSSRHIRLDREALRRWRRLRSEAQRDLPLLIETMHMLEQLRASLERPDAKAEVRLIALKRRIEESRLRFSIG